MMTEDIKKIRLGLDSLTVFRGLLSDPVISGVRDCFSALAEGRDSDAVSAYSGFVSRLFEEGYCSLTSYLKDAVCADENVYVKARSRGDKASEAVIRSVERELSIIRKLSALTSEEFLKCMPADTSLSAYETENVDIAAVYKERTDNIGKYGYGVFVKYHMFCFENGQILPVKHPDGITLDMLIGYEYEHKAVLDNTLALLNGKPASNVLLTGDAGTGKSSTVKAVVNELYPEGLRIVEIRKEQLRFIPTLLDELAPNPLKFIIFIDDLSLANDDDNLSALKAVLEGSISAKSQNVVIYATSNRRHIVKETFSDRDGDEIHRNDTMQELMSLSDRFGMHISFSKPNKETYLEIVRSLADKAGITMAKDRLDFLAEKFALIKGGRSARTAKQFVDRLLSDDETVKE